MQTTSRLICLCSAAAGVHLPTLQARPEALPRSVSCCPRGLYIRDLPDTAPALLPPSPHPPPPPPCRPSGRRCGAAWRSRSRWHQSLRGQGPTPRPRRCAGRTSGSWSGWTACRRCWRSCRGCCRHQRRQHDSKERGEQRLHAAACDPSVRLQLPRMPRLHLGALQLLILLILLSIENESAKRGWRGWCGDPRRRRRKKGGRAPRGGAPASAQRVQWASDSMRALEGALQGIARGAGLYVLARQRGWSGRESTQGRHMVQRVASGGGDKRAQEAYHPPRGFAGGADVKCIEWHDDGMRHRLGRGRDRMWRGVGSIQVRRACRGGLPRGVGSGRQG